MKKKSPTRHTTLPKMASKPATAASAVAEPVIAAPVVVKPVMVEIVAQPVVEVVAVAVVETVVEAAAPQADAAADALLAARSAALQNPSAEVAVDAAAALAASADARCVPALIQALVNADGFYHTVTRSAAAMALGSFNGSPSTAALLAAVRDPMAEVSREAALALGTLGCVEAIPALSDIAENADGYYLDVVRHAAVRSLGRLKAAAAKPVLEALTQTPPSDPALAAAAREALAQL